MINSSRLLGTIIIRSVPPSYAALMTLRACLPTNALVASRSTTMSPSAHISLARLTRLYILPILRSRRTKQKLSVPTSVTRSLNLSHTHFMIFTASNSSSEASSMYTSRYFVQFWASKDSKKGLCRDDDSRLLPPLRMHRGFWRCGELGRVYFLLRYQYQAYSSNGESGLRLSYWYRAQVMDLPFLPSPSKQAWISLGSWVKLRYSKVNLLSLRLGTCTLSKVSNLAMAGLMQDTLRGCSDCSGLVTAGRIWMKMFIFVDSSCLLWGMKKVLFGKFCPTSPKQGRFFCTCKGLNYCCEAYFTSSTGLSTSTISALRQQEKAMAETTTRIKIKVAITPFLSLFLFVFRAWVLQSSDKFQLISNFPYLVFLPSFFTFFSLSFAGLWARGRRLWRVYSSAFRSLELAQQPSELSMTSQKYFCFLLKSFSDFLPLSLALASSFIYPIL